MTVAVNSPPGPKGRFLTGHLGTFHRDITSFYERLAREYGDCAGFRLGPRRLALISNPDWIEQILVTDAKNYGKMTYVLKMLVPLLGNGLLNSDGDFWLRQRRLIQPAFLKHRIAGYAEPMVAFSRRMAEEWNDGDEFDLHEQMMKLTLEIVAKALFDADVTDDADDVGEAMKLVMHNFLNRWGSFLPLPRWLPTRSNRRYLRSRRRLDEIIYRFIAERRASGADRDDLLSLLLRARDEDGSRMTDKQLRDEAMTLFIAGHETTAVAMTYTWYLLARHPHVEEKLLEEIQTVIGGRDATVTDVPKLKYTEAVMLESMRLYPPAYAFARVAKRDTDFGDCRIRAGTTVIVSQWVMQRDPRWWDDPETFRPERWLDGSTANLPKFVYFPFGGGPRRCIGDTFAMMETILILATMTPRVRFELLSNEPLKVRAAVTLRPVDGLPVKTQRRR